MPLHKYKAVVQYGFTLFNQHNLTAFQELLDPTSVVHNPSLAAGIGGRAEYLQLLAAILRAFPDARLVVEDIFGEGNKVVVRYTFTGTQQGEYLGIPATGKEVRVSYVGIFQLAGNRVQEMWLMPDRLGLLRQLGALHKEPA